MVQSSGKDWLQQVKKVLKASGPIASLILTAPLKLPNQVLLVAKYLLLVVGIVKATEKTDE